MFARGRDDFHRMDQTECGAAGCRRAGGGRVWTADGRAVSVR
jgi:hypothetical protein